MDRFVRAFGIAIVALILAFCTLAYAGGPRYVAGTAYFDAAVTGKPIVWAGGQLRYYTDLGDLSASVNQAQANSMIATAAAIWNAVPTAAVNIASAGSLGEDVSGANVSRSGSNLTLPTDIQSGDTSKPIAIVYDEDGSVINAFFGPDASTPTMCQQNGVFVFDDNLSSSGNIVHALVILNGLCATTADNLAVLQYQLVRAFGQVLGLDWSQANEENFGSQPTSAALQGWPIMHPIERLCNRTGVTCMPNGTTLRPDDIAALNRLYSVTADNIANFKNKKLTAPNTLSVTGTIHFRNGQGMQGVNVVLRPMIPGTTLPDVRYTVTAVSGVRFRGNAGNLVSGYTDSAGNPLVRFGSNDLSLEGHFDLSGVPIPPGYTTDTWQLSLEPINSLYTGMESVGPYTTGQVTPSGTLPAIAIPGLAAGSSVIQNVTIGNSAGDSLSGDDGLLSAAVTVPPTGEWTARLAGYGHTSWLQWWAKANREFTVEAYALDDKGQPTLNKAQVVLGMWNGTDPMAVSPVTYTPQPFNGAVAGLTKLPVLTLASSEVRLGVSDMRGDGRPDYLYRGRVLYADSVRPAILSAKGGPITITGMGFRPDSVVYVNGAAATVTSISPNEITANAPASNGATGTVPVEVKDPQTLGIAIIADGVSYGSGNDDTINIVTAPSGTVTPGAPLPFTVAVASGTSPAAGATVTYSVTQGTATLSCGQPSCSIVTAANGTASLAVAASSTTTTAVTATLANGASVTSQFTAQSGPAAAISPLTPNLYLAAGAIATWTPQGLVLKNGTPSAGTPVTWTAKTSGIFAPTSATLSGTNGIVSQQLTVGPLPVGDIVAVNACLTTGSNCAQFNVVSVSPVTALLQPIAGVAQNVPAGTPFTPVVLEVTDAAGDPLAGAVVTFYETLDAWTQPCSAEAFCPPAPLIQQTTVQAVSAQDGTVVLNPISGSGDAVRLYITAVTGSSGLLNFKLEQHP
ncbi:MAG TPA: IPT/TIG domain-containing protein [Acidobacteriaceae bacterium]|nr:IPT/TIG domain-containing protein [Acidobacteriaceae bacterium]